jgi:hypothetical protein
MIPKLVTAVHYLLIDIIAQRIVTIILDYNLLSSHQTRTATRAYSWPTSTNRPGAF